MDTSNHVKVEASDGRSVTVAPEFAGFVRAVLDYGVDIADVLPEEDDANNLSLVFLSEEDARMFADLVLSELMVPCAPPGKEDPVIHGHVMFSMEEFDGEKEVGVTIFVDFRRELLDSVAAMFALMASREKAVPEDASWDGRLVSLIPDMDRVAVGGRVLLALHSHSPHWVEHVWVKVVCLDGPFFGGVVEADAKDLKNVKSGTPVRFALHQVLAADPPRAAAAAGLN